MTTIPVEATAPDRPAARANGTVRPSAIPITMSRTASDEVKCFSTCGDWGIVDSSWNFAVGLVVRDQWPCRWWMSG